MASRPREVAADVYWLGIGRGTRQSNVYFVRSRSSWALVDTGWQGSGPAIARAAAALFGRDSRPSAILLTHLHPDHSGAARELAQRWGAPVYAHADELPQAAGGILPQYANPLDRWVIGPLLRLMPAQARERLAAQSSLEGIIQPLDIAAGIADLPEWEIIPTPGHTPGHVSYFRRSDGVLIAGDACLTINTNSPWEWVRARQRVSGPPYISTWNWRTAKVSVATLARLDPDTLASGHGVPMTAVTPAHELRAFAERFTGATRRPTATQRAGRLAFWLQCQLQRRFMRLGVWLFRVTDGAIARPFGARGEVMLLTTRGRWSGKRRAVIVQGFRDGADLVIAASNNGQSANPGWYYNLTATPSARIELGGRALSVRATELSAGEAAAFWPRILRVAPEYDKARHRANRVIPLMRLTPVEEPTRQTPTGSARVAEPTTA